MGYYHEIVEYLGTRDARFTVYGTVLGIFVLYLIRVVYRAFVIWKKLLIEGGQRSFNHFLIWMLYHYRQCPRWLRFLSVRVARFLALFNINLLKTARSARSKQRYVASKKKPIRQSKAHKR